LKFTAAYVYTFTGKPTVVYTRANLTAWATSLNAEATTIPKKIDWQWMLSQGMI